MPLIDKLMELSKRSQLSREEKQLLFDTVVALKAGQDMRDSLGIARLTTRLGDRTYIQAEVGDNCLAVRAIKSWDAATKGEDV